MAHHDVRLQCSKLSRTHPRKVGCRYLRQPLQVLLVESCRHHDRLPSTCGLRPRKRPRFRIRRGFRGWLRHDSNRRDYRRVRLLQPTYNRYLHNHLCCQLRYWCGQSCRGKLRVRHHARHRARHRVHHHVRHRVRHRVHHHVHDGRDVHVRRSSSW